MASNVENVFMFWCHHVPSYTTYCYFSPYGVYWLGSVWSVMYRSLQLLDAFSIYHIRHIIRWATPLTHWGRATRICVGKLTIIVSNNGLWPGRRQAIIWTSAGILIIRPLGTNFSEILIRNQTFSLRKMHLKISSAKWRPFCLGLNVLTFWGLVIYICPI